MTNNYTYILCKHKFTNITVAYNSIDMQIK